MPRKKSPQKLVDYLVPVGTYKKAQQIVENNKRYKNKDAWIQKLLYLFEYISEQNHEKKNFDYVNIHVETMAKVLGVNNQDMSTMLSEAVNSNILVKDGIMKKAEISRRGGERVYISTGKSFGYKFINEYKVESVTIHDTRLFSSKTREKETTLFIRNESLNKYKNVLNKISINTNDIHSYIEKIIENKRKNLKRQSEYQIYISNKELEFYNNNTKQPTYNIPFDGIIVPVKSAKTKKRKRKVPFHVTPYQPLEFIKQEALSSSDEASIKARVYHYIKKINAGHIIPKRPVLNSRVYSLITNLNRELRVLIELDGKKVAAIDIRNSQPLLASIIVRKYWLNKESELPEDVLKYQESCEKGKFYDDFMKDLNLPSVLRSEFKQDFFKKVFFSKVIEKNNMLKDMFIERYPNVWNCICDEKGGLYSTSYGEFAKKLQMVEATLIYDVVNVQLIDMGINAFNIFDSIYVSSWTDYKVAENLLKEAFNEVGVNPTFNPEYKEHLDCNL